MSRITEVEYDSQWLTVAWDDGARRKYPAVWLRDNIPSGRHRAEGQRTFDINELPPIALTTAAVSNGGVAVDFGDVQDIFPGEWLADHSLDAPAGPVVTPDPVLWDATIQPTLEFVDYEAVLADDPTRLRWLTGIRDRGFGLLRNTPVEENTVMKVVETFGVVRETNYGRLFDVVVRPDPANLANTSARIGMHTDNPYRDPVPGLQLLHCIVNETDGGESQLCDGYAVAEKLRQVDPAAFEALTTLPVKFRYLDEGDCDIQYFGPLIRLDSRGRVVEVRYNSRSVSPFQMSADLVPEFYRAYRVLAEALHEPNSAIQFRLGSGDLMIFDNQRVLHGRSAYTIGHRHLQGCYADKDALTSTIRVLESA